MHRIYIPVPRLQPWSRLESPWMLQTARNVAIIMLLALIVAVVPGGDAAAEAILVALSMAFLAAIAWFVARLYRDQQLTLATMPDVAQGDPVRRASARSAC